MVKLIRARDYAHMSRRAADILFAAITLKPHGVLGLATGSTPVGMYEQLVERHKQGDLDFASVRSVNLDEYVGLDETSDQSYRWFMNHHLFDHVNIKKENTSVPSGKAKDIEAECRSYDRLIEEMGGIDLQVLGIGNNGHIGFNEPGETFEKGTHIVHLAQRTIEANARFFASANDVPKSAITMGVQPIMQAKAVLLLASGEGKREILEAALFGPITPRVPASILQLHANLIVVADEAALRSVVENHADAL